tara:strand:- start:319 stop:570 length:252 start_codon:yes stop_codon:yes gene_type:complete
MLSPTFEKQISDPKFSSSSFSAFLSEILSRRCRLSRTTSDPAKKVKKISPKLRVIFPFFPAKNLARFCHAVRDFREHQGLPPD